MKWWARWDGTKLLVAQRPSLLVHVGLAVCAIAFVIALPLHGGEMVEAAAQSRWGDAISAAVILVVLGLAVTGLLWFMMERHCNAEMDASAGVVIRRPGRRRSVSIAGIDRVVMRREKRWVSSRYGRGNVPFVILSLHERGGRSKELLEMDETRVDDASWTALRDGLASLPFGKNELVG